MSKSENNSSLFKKVYFCKKNVKLKKLPKIIGVKKIYYTSFY